ncbi:unnamed protein product [Leptidea sinapis]|uniref:Uncharacterized protein n=1 Tax=Leptidea sinapis TaxID=189913 RepID=A0A5E4QVZ4_9NEOP|nr:unnamed protein product [Leptidea sinapis]
MSVPILCEDPVSAGCDPSPECTLSTTPSTEAPTSTTTVAIPLLSQVPKDQQAPLLLQVPKDQQAPLLLQVPKGQQAPPLFRAHKLLPQPQLLLLKLQPPPLLLQLLK